MSTIHSIPGPSVEVPREVTPSSPQGAPGGPDFGAALTNAIGSVEQLQVEGDEQAAKAALGGGNLHELSLALEKADVAMRVATKVRNKIIDAYHDVMRMSM